MILYDDPISGNGYKLRLLFALTGQAYTYRIVSILDRETKSAAFLVKNPVGQIPAVELDDGTLFRESNAMLVHFARGTDYWPNDPLMQTRVLEWLFWEQYVHEPNVAVLRSYYVKNMLDQVGPDAVATKTEGAKAALSLLDKELAGKNWLVGEAMSIADISLYAYSHLIGDSGLDVNAYPYMAKWIERIAAIEAYVDMETYTPA